MRLPPVGRLDRLRGSADHFADTVDRSASPCVDLTPTEEQAMSEEDRHAKIQQRAYEIWQREGSLDGDHERHWHQAEMEIDREAALPLTAGDALPETREIDSADVLTVEALAVRTGISGDEAQELLDRLGNDRAAIEQAARSLKAKRRSQLGD
jgi:hypothetical protein